MTDAQKTGATVKKAEDKGNGDMYENLPHYCPVELFRASSDQSPQPIHDNLVQTLRNKLYQLEMDLQKESEEEVDGLVKGRLSQFNLFNFL